MLVRVPLGAMRDVEFPLRGDGFLDLSRAGQTLRDAALLWLAARAYRGVRISSTLTLPLRKQATVKNISGRLSVELMRTPR